MRLNEVGDILPQYMNDLCRILYVISEIIYFKYVKLV